jgi:succinoglycan biosynthesis protein ExoA
MVPMSDISSAASSPSFLTEATQKVTVAIPTYNEAEYIEKVVMGFLSTKYSHLVEILIADGNSTDHTCEIVANLSARDPRVRLIHNPDKIQSAGLNLMLKASQSDVFLRADAHSEYADDYIEQCIAALDKSGAVNVGGSQRYVANTVFQSAVALASKSWLTGVAKYRSAEYNGFADTVFLGCFRKEALLKVEEHFASEVFDTKQVRNQDLELNLKLAKIYENAVYVSSQIRVFYFPRKTISALWLQYFKDGRGSFVTAAKSMEKSPLRQKAPFFALLFLFLLVLSDVVLFEFNLKSFYLVMTIAMIPIVEAIRVNITSNQIFNNEIWKGDENKNPCFVTRLFLSAIALFVMPIAYALGYGYQLMKNKVFRFEGW